MSCQGSSRRKSESLIVTRLGFSARSSYAPFPMRVFDTLVILLLRFFVHFFIRFFSRATLGRSPSTQKQ